MLYLVRGKYAPSVHDLGTVYGRTKCGRCGGILEPIEKLGVYFPSWSKPFGLVFGLGGIVASRAASEYLAANGVGRFTLKVADVRYAGHESKEEYLWIIPEATIKYAQSRHARIKKSCRECGKRRIIYDNMHVPKYQEEEPAHLSKLEDSLNLVADECFVSLMANVPGKSYLAFDPWFTVNTHPNLAY